MEFVLTSEQWVSYVKKKFIGFVIFDRKCSKYKKKEKNKFVFNFKTSAAFYDSIL